MSPASGGDLVAAAESLCPELRAAGDEIDNDRRLPDRIVDAMKDAGLFRMALPFDLGGLQADPISRRHAVQAIAAANGSAGWIAALFSGQAHWAAGWLPPETAAELFSTGQEVLLTAMLLPEGRARRAPGGYRVHGRWRFGSGCVHANWFASLCEIYDGDSPVRNEQGVPATAMFVTPASAVIIHETWDSLGLRGTSSHDYSITDAFVPEGWQFDLLGRSVRQGEAYFANPHIFGTLTTVPLGIARGAIDTVTALLRKKQAGPANLAVRDDAAVQIDLGRAVSLVDMAARYADGTLDEVWSQFQSGSRPTDRQLAGADLTKANEVSAAVEAMNIAFRLAGSSGVHRSSAIERCFRDVHTAASHVTLRPQARYQRGGRRLLSVSAGPPPAI